MIKKTKKKKNKNDVNVGKENSEVIFQSGRPPSRQLLIIINRQMKNKNKKKIIKYQDRKEHKKKSIFENKLFPVKKIENKKQRKLSEHIESAA